jgi:tryptophanyl-tRNA synthetase
MASVSQLVSQNSRFYLSRRQILVPGRGFPDPRNEEFLLFGTTLHRRPHIGFKTLLDEISYFTNAGIESVLLVSDIESSLTDKRPLQYSADLGKQTVKLVQAAGANMQLVDISYQSDACKNRLLLPWEYLRVFTEAELVRRVGTTSPRMIAAVLLQLSDILGLQRKKAKRAVVVGSRAQDAAVSLARDAARKTGDLLPGSIYHTHIKGLDGKRLSRNRPSRCLFLSDSEETVRNKIRKALSGGGPTLKQHQKLGALNYDCCIELLRYHHSDSMEFNELERAYRTGTITSADLKRRTADVIVEGLSPYRTALMVDTRDG